RSGESVWWRACSWTSRSIRRGRRSSTCEGGPSYRRFSSTPRNPRRSASHRESGRDGSSLPSGPPFLSARLQHLERLRFFRWWKQPIELGQLLGIERALQRSEVLAQAIGAAGLGNCDHVRLREQPG